MTNVRQVALGIVLTALAVLAGCTADARSPRASNAEPANSIAADRADAARAVDEDKSSSGACTTAPSSFGAIQKLIFERHGCTARACHGGSKMGMLDLRDDVAYESIVDAPSVNSRNARVQPGTANQSFLYQKLQAAAQPGSVEIAGSPMPIGGAPLLENELAAVQLWITQGAPKTGTVVDHKKGVDVGTLLDACLPPLDKPAKSKSLEPPPRQEGVQLLLPRYLLEGGTEIEHCTPFVYDLSDQVPEEFKDTERNVMFVNSSRVRQDPQSHHLVVWNAGVDPKTLTPDNDTWTCRGGQAEGTSCDPRQGSSDCGDGGVCAGETVASSFCGERGKGLGGGGLFGSAAGSLANTQSPQEYVAPLDGVYWEIPLRGLAGFDSHAFNLDEADTVLEARVNYYFAVKRERRIQQRGAVDNVSIAAGQPPFTRKTYCAKYVSPQNYSLAVMTGHTHRRGERFWVNDPSGTMIYESLVYSDPLYKRYDPWLEFTSPNPADRTLEYCATFNNGLTKNDTPDLELVTRASRMPERTSCTPVACVAGKLAAPCTTHADCDTSPDAGDGDCDACPITAGQTTENEMFLITPWYVAPPKQ